MCGTHNGSSGSAAGGLLRKRVGTIDYPVSGPYVTRPTPVQPHVLYAVDLTAPNAMDYLNLLLEDILPTWAQEQPPPAGGGGGGGIGIADVGRQTTRAAIVLVTGRGIYIPLMEDSLNGSSFVCVPDVQEEPFCPFPLNDFTWDLGTKQKTDDGDDVGGWSQMHARWTELMDTAVPQLVAKMQADKLAHNESIPGYSVSAGGAALGFLVDALQETGGRAVYLSWRRPNYGAGKLLDRASLARDQAYQLQEPLLYTPMRLDQYYGGAGGGSNGLAQKASDAKVAVDIILHTNPQVPQSYLDIATLQQVCQRTNGRLTWISSNSNLWRTSMKHALLRPLQFTGWDAVLKVRVSTGLRIQSMDTSVGTLRKAQSLTDDSPECELSVVTPDTTFGIQLEHRVGGLPKNTKFVYVQSALLYTNPWNGQRRVRVSTLALRVAPVASIAFGSMDFGTLACRWLRDIATRVREQKEAVGEEVLIQLRQELVDKCTAVLVGHRQYGASVQAKASASPSQLLLPDKLSLLPLFVMSLIKSPLLRSSLSQRATAAGAGLTTANPNADQRAYHLLYASQANPAIAFWMVYPLVIDLNASTLKRWQQPGKRLPDDAHRLDRLKHAPFVWLPDPILPRMENLEDTRPYLIATTGGVQGMYVWVGKDVPPETMEALQRVVLEEEDNTTTSSNDLDDDTNDATNTTQDEQAQEREQWCSNLRRAVRQIRVWSQVGCEPRWLRPVWDSLEFVHHDKAEDVASWLVADAGAREQDYTSFLVSLQQNVLKKQGGSSK